MNKDLQSRQNALEGLSSLLIKEGNASIDTFLKNREIEISNRHAKQKQSYENQKTKSGRAISVYIQTIKNYGINSDTIVLGLLFLSLMVLLSALFIGAGMLFFAAVFDMFNIQKNEIRPELFSVVTTISFWIYFLFIRKTETLLTTEYLCYVNDTKNENEKITEFRTLYNKYVYQINLPESLVLVFSRGVYGYSHYIDILGKIPVSKTLLTTLSELMSKEDFKTMFHEHGVGEDQSIMLDTVLRETAKIRKAIFSEEKANCFYP